LAPSTPKPTTSLICLLSPIPSLVETLCRQALLQTTLPSSLQRLVCTEVASTASREVVYQVFPAAEVQ
jgi:hypothetical protein